MKALVDEIRGAFTKLDDLTFENLAELKYMNACKLNSIQVSGVAYHSDPNTLLINSTIGLKEALRIYPPVPIGSPRVVLQGGQVILGKWVPPETRVSVHHWSTYQSEANFKNATTFAPERWLKSDPSYAGDALDAHQPFGFGPRNCLGQNMAMHEMRLILATLIFKFDFEICEESRNWAAQKAFALWIKSPMRVRAKPVSAQARLNI